MMARIVFWQLVAAVVYILLAVMVGGKNAGISALLGTMSYVMPNMFFALGFHILGRREKEQVSLGAFLGLEIGKVVLTMGCMIASVWFYRDVSWVYFLLGLAIALKSYILLLLKNRS